MKEKEAGCGVGTQLRKNAQLLKGKTTQETTRQLYYIKKNKDAEIFSYNFFSASSSSLVFAESQANTTLCGVDQFSKPTTGFNTFIKIITYKALVYKIRIKHKMCASLLLAWSTFH